MGVVYEEEIAYISSRIRELRKEKHLTVQELAYRCDMERSNLSRIEAGRTNLTIRTICIICSALEVGLCGTSFDSEKTVRYLFIIYRLYITR